MVPAPHPARRYIMMRVTEQMDVLCSWDPKPVPGDWPGTGCSVKYSTAETRVQGAGWFEVERQIFRLVENHQTHMMVRT